MEVVTVSPQWDRSLLTRQIRHKSLLPEGRLFAALDTAMTNSERSDYSVLALGLVTEPMNEEPSRLWLRHIEFGRWSAKQLPVVTAKFFQTWNPERAVGEDINGIQFFKVLLDQEFEKLNIKPRIHWLPASRDMDAKTYRVERLVRLHLEDRLRLAAGGWNDEFLSEAERWVGGHHGRNKHRHDDLLDVSGLLAQQFMRR